MKRLAADKSLAPLIKHLEHAVEHGQVTPGVAADRVIESFLLAHRGSQASSP
ncbi:hypothetical protein BC828DRAFT_389868 [Blastocladiella britannica]|nr:hypothetical protein BC828DRAFT_389868 [Blastocladiella britannica]